MAFLITCHPTLLSSTAKIRKGQVRISPRGSLPAEPSQQLVLKQAGTIAKCLFNALEVVALPALLCSFLLTGRYALSFQAHFCLTTFVVKVQGNCCKVPWRNQSKSVKCVVQ